MAVSGVGVLRDAGVRAARLFEQEVIPGLEPQAARRRSVPPAPGALASGSLASQRGRLGFAGWGCLDGDGVIRALV
ncbi:MAG TPA: hypothetical protein VF832_11240, partial [Longimicrobiales bacterium]